MTLQQLTVERDRAHNNGLGTPETGKAVEEFTHAVNEGVVEIAYAMEGNGFVGKSPSPGP